MFSRYPKYLVRLRTLSLVCLVAVVCGGPVGATAFYLAIDVPTRLGGIDRTANQVLRSDSGIYALALDLPVATELAALHRRSDGVWMFSPAHPLTLGAATYEPRDIVAFDGVNYSMLLDGSGVGIPEYARIDALFQHPIAGIVLSFDVPVKLSGTEYSRSDLVRFNGGVFSLFWDAATAGVPLYSNVVGAAIDSAGAQVLSFDVPTNIAGTEYLPGQLVRWNNPGFSNYFIAAGWPVSTQLRDFAFVPPSGVVPNGSSAPGTPLTVTQAGGGQITLNWGVSCSSSDTDYEIYEGTIGIYYSHASKFCTTSGATTKTFTPASTNSYYLVVPRNAVSEGAYGTASGGAQIPQGSSACVPQEVAVSCN